MSAALHPVSIVLGVALHLVVTACADVTTTRSIPAAAIGDDGIVSGSVGSAMLDTDKIGSGVQDIASGGYGNIHSLLIFRRGKLASERYFAGEDENNHRGKIGVVEHDRDTLHDVRSISKSVVALAVLKAVELGHIKHLDRPVFDYFPEYRARHAQGSKASITIRHLLTMTAGLDWNEEVPFAHPDSSPAKFRDAPDPLDFVLGRKLIAKPGAQFRYNGGLTQLLAAIVHRSTGQTVEAFTKRELFDPLGITKSEWAKRNDGEPDADSGLRLRSRDLAKIGLLVANDGMWNGKQVIPSALVAEAVSQHVGIPQEREAEALGDRQGYGYQIWLFSFLIGPHRIELIEFSGNGGQKVFIDRKNELMVVVTAGNYDRRGLKKSPLDIYIDLIHPALLDR